MCDCPRDQLCPLCFDGSWQNLRGAAATRGEVWADQVAKVIDRSRPWPAHEGRAAAIARSKVEDLSRDPRLVEQLAAELARWAAKRWESRRAQSQ